MYILHNNISGVAFNYKDIFDLIKQFALPLVSSKIQIL